MNKKYNENAPVVRGERIFSVVLTCAVLAVILLANVLLYVLNVNFGIFYVVPEEEDLTLISGSMDELFAEAERHGATVEISFCMSEDEVKLHQTGSFVYKTAVEYQKRYPNFIKLNFINLITKQDKDGKNVADRLQSYLDDEYELRTNSVIFSCGDNYRIVTDTQSSAGFVGFYTLDSSGNAIAYDGEEVVASCISQVISDASDRSKAYLTVGHTEQIDPSFAKLIELAGYESDTIDLSKKAVPEDCDLLIIFAPRNDFQTASVGSNIEYAQTECGRLEAYLKRGGNLYVALDPYVKSLPSLEGILKSCGISVSESDLDGSVVRDVVRDPRNSLPSNPFAIITEYAGGAMAQSISDKVGRYTDGKVIIRYAAALNLSGSAEAILKSSSSSVCEDSGVTTRTGGDFTIAAYNRLTLEGGTAEATVFVNSSIYLTVSSALVTNGYANKDFVYAVFENMFGAKNPPYGTNAVLYDTQTLENLTTGTATLYTVIAIVIPVCLAAVGTVIVIKRKNR